MHRAEDIILSPDQESLVGKEFSGPARIRGTSGSGKTLVAMHRAIRAAGAGRPVLFVTFNHTLAKKIVVLLEEACGVDPAPLEKIRVSTLHGWCRDHLGMLDGSLPRFDGTGVKNALKRAVKKVAPAVVQGTLFDAPQPEEDVEFLAGEIAYLKGRFANEQVSDYLTVQRLGREQRLKREERQRILDIYSAYQRELESESLKDFEDWVREALKSLERGDRLDDLDRAVIVDEVQDMNELDLRLLSHIPRSASNGFLMVGDGAQKLYARGYSLRRLGIDISGRSLVLRKNYRNTREIMEAAHALIQDFKFEDQDEEKQEPPMDPEWSERRGSRPVLKWFRSVDDEAKWVAASIREAIDSGVKPEHVAVLAQGKKYRDTFHTALRRSGIKVQDYQEPAPGAPATALLSTLFSVKGLEFAWVFIVGLVEGLMPLASEGEGHSLARQVSLLYVGMTRARERLFLTYSLTKPWGGPAHPSRFLDAIKPYCDILSHRPK